MGDSAKGHFQYANSGSFPLANDITTKIHTTTKLSETVFIKTNTQKRIQKTNKRKEKSIAEARGMRYMLTWSATKSKNQK